MEAAAHVPKTKRLRVILAVMGLASLACVAGYLVRNREPTYQNRSLSAWLNDYREAVETPGSVSNPLAARQAAANAVKAIGTNALPTLLIWQRVTANPAPE